jgi:hypothetical protein
MKKIEEEFPELEELEWIHVDAPGWWSKTDLSAWMNTKLEASLLNDASFYKDLYENSKDFKVTWQLKQKDPHETIRRQFEEARERCDAVLVEWFNCGEWVECSMQKNLWIPTKKYRLKHYKFNPTKALAWSYREGGVFIPVWFFITEPTEYKKQDFLVGRLEPSEFHDWNILMYSGGQERIKIEVDKEGNVKLSNGTTVNIYKDCLIDEWFDEE